MIYKIDNVQQKNHTSQNYEYTSVCIFQYPDLKEVKRTG